MNYILLRDKCVDENILNIDHWLYFMNNIVQFPVGIQDLLLTLIGTIAKWIKLIPQRHRELLHNKVKRPVVISLRPVQLCFVLKIFRRCQCEGFRNYCVRVELR